MKCKAIFDPDGAQVECNRRSGHEGKHDSGPSEWEYMGEPDPDLPGRWRMRWSSGRPTAHHYVKVK